MPDDNHEFQIPIRTWSREGNPLLQARETAHPGEEEAVLDSAPAAWPSFFQAQTRRSMYDVRPVEYFLKKACLGFMDAHKT